MEDYSQTILDLVRRSNEIDEQISSDRLNVLEKQYAKLKSLVSDRHLKLDELVELAKFRRHLDEVERWIREKEMVAGNEDTGAKLEQTLILMERYKNNYMGTYKRLYYLVLTPCVDTFSAS